MPKTTIRGTSGADVMHGGASTILAGGKGNDIYYLWDATSTVQESIGEGVDTVYACYWGPIKLAAAVENLYLMTDGSTQATGNALDNSIYAGSVGARLDGARGDDMLHGGAGQDVFRIVAGQGNDTIYNFTSGFDIITLENHAFTSLAQIRASAAQVGSDVSINLGNGEKLLIKGVALNGLVAADFGYSNVGGKAPAGYTLMSGAGKTIVENGVFVANNVWNPGTYVEGRDYSIDSYWSSGKLTSGTTFNWDFPVTTDRYAPVRAYPEIIFGVSPYGDTVNATDKTQSFPIKLSTLDSLTATYDTSYSGNTGGFNVSYDIWLTSKPNGDGSTITNEIMLWTHGHSYTPWGDYIGTFNDGAFNGKIYHTGTYTAIILDKDVPAGTLDIRALLDRLIELGVVSNDEWLASVQYGAEVISGVGSLTINQLEMALTVDDGLGGLVSKLIDGSGAQLLTSPDVVATLPYIAVEDAYGLLAGYQATATDSVGDPLIHLYDRGGNLTGTDSIKTVANGNIFTEHRDAAGNVLGLDGRIFNADGSITNTRYDADHHLLGWDSVATNKNGSVSTTSYNGGGIVTGSMLETVSGNVQRTEYFDADGNRLSTDVIVTAASGNSVVRHYDGANRLVSSDRYLVADDSLTVKHYGATGKLTGGRVEHVDQQGVLVERHYGSGWKLTGTTYTGTLGNDEIVLGGGTNRVHGGGGSDHFVAGGGWDNFYLDGLLDGDVVTIEKFSVVRDTIHLDGDAFAGLSAGGLAAGAFVLGSQAQDAADRVIYDAADGTLFYDADGAGGAAAVLIAQMDPGLSLTHLDFIIG